MTTAEYNHCVKEYADRLFRFALKTISDGDDAKDVVQVVFETLWIKKEQVPLDKAKSFLFTIVHRRCMDIFRKRKRIMDTEENQQIITNPTNRFELKEQLNFALNQLEPQAKTLIILKDYEGYNYEEISEITQLSLSQVKVYLHRTRQKLKEYLSAHQ